MIVVKLQGGLGNQMFQYSAGYALAKDTDLYLDTSFYNNQDGITPRQYNLHQFPKLKANLYSRQQNGKPFVRITEPESYQPIPMFSEQNIYLDGYFQTEKYFKYARDAICLAFSPDDNVIEGFKAKYSHLNGNTVSLHVRRTDYINVSHVHTLQSLDYYYDALKIIGKFDQLYVFSDDIAWCKDNLKIPRTTYVEGNSDVEDMWLMSMCNNHVIANSSFSWWGAWLSKSKKIVAPKNWFGPGGPKYWNDIYCEDWIVL